MSSPYALVPIRSANSSCVSLTSSIGGGTRGKVIISGCTGIERSTIRLPVLRRSFPRASVGRVRHAADEDVARLDLVELLERRDVARGTLDHAGRRGQALDLARRGRLAG